jgi:hypothetical protein
MSKSLNNTVDPLEVSWYFSIDNFMLTVHTPRYWTSFPQTALDITFALLLPMGRI